MILTKPLNPVVALATGLLGGALVLSSVGLMTPAVAQESTPAPESTSPSTEIAPLPETSTEFPLEELPPDSTPLNGAETPETTDSPFPADFPAALVGQEIGPVTADLVADGWMVVVRTPGLVQLDKDQMGLDLAVDPGSGQIIEAELLDLL